METCQSLPKVLIIIIIMIFPHIIIHQLQIKAGIPDAPEIQLDKNIVKWSIPKDNGAVINTYIILAKLELEALLVLTLF